MNTAVAVEEVLPVHPGILVLVGPTAITEIFCRLSSGVNPLLRWNIIISLIVCDRGDLGDLYRHLGCVPRQWSHLEARLVVSR